MSLEALSVLSLSSMDEERSPVPGRSLHVQVARVPPIELAEILETRP